MRHSAFGLLLLVSGLLLCGVAADDHDCIVGSPPLCNHSLADDRLCRGLYSSDIRAWQTMDCDYVIYDVKAKVPSNKYIVIHAGGCDEYTEVLGDWAYSVMNTNLFGLRPCAGLDSQSCTLNRSRCDAFHVSWTMPSQPPQLGLGFNPPALISYAKDPSSKLLFIHEFDGLPTYTWAGTCNATHPAYICVYGSDDDATFERKFYGGQGSLGMKDLLEDMQNSEYLPCAVEAIDARNSSLTPGVDNGPTWGKAYATNRNPELPCSGLYPQIETQGWALELQNQVSSGVRLAILEELEGTGNGTSGILGLFQEALEIALGD